MPNLLYLVLILILLEVTQIFTDKETVETVSECLNPYSTGSNSNTMLVKRDVDTDSLNPYSTGSNSNMNYGAVIITRICKS